MDSSGRPNTQIGVILALMALFLVITAFLVGRNIRRLYRAAEDHHRKSMVLHSIAPDEVIRRYEARVLAGMMQNGGAGVGGGVSVEAGAEAGVEDSGTGTGTSPPQGGSSIGGGSNGRLSPGNHDDLVSVIVQDFETLAVIRQMAEEGLPSYGESSRVGIRIVASDETQQSELEQQQQESENENEQESTNNTPINNVLRMSSGGGGVGGRSGSIAAVMAISSTHQYTPRRTARPGRSSRSGLLFGGISTSTISSSSGGGGHSAEPSNSSSSSSGTRNEVQVIPPPPVETSATSATAETIDPPRDYDQTHLDRAPSYEQSMAMAPSPE